MIVAERPQDLVTPIKDIAEDHAARLADRIDGCAAVSRILESSSNSGNRRQAATRAPRSESRVAVGVNIMCEHGDHVLD